jgi:hypothetical protein
MHSTVTKNEMIKTGLSLGIMQPYFFPYLGYFDVINRVDKWIVFDGAKYSHKSWMNRNRILHPQDGWQYISVPVRKNMGAGRICDVIPVDLALAELRLLGQLQHYRKGRAPYFREVTELVKKTFAMSNLVSLSDLNVASLKTFSEYLGIKFDYAVFTQMNLDLPEISHPGQWALEISDKVGAKRYLNPPNGKDIFVPQEWSRRGIELQFTKLIDFRYSCGSYTPVEHLSILDVLMWSKPSDVKLYLDARRVSQTKCTAL